MKQKDLIIVLSCMAAIAIFSNFFALSGESDPQKRRKSATPEVDTILTNIEGSGPRLFIEFTRGAAHNHPLMAIWVEDTSGRYIQTLYVARSIATGIFQHGDSSQGQWTRGEIRRPAALPYWAHKRGIKAEDGLYLPSPSNPVPDAYSGATPKIDFMLDTRLNETGSSKFYVLLEINQPWDWNDYWTNAKFPGDYEYKSSAQPAVVYRVLVNTESTLKEFPMEVIGHSHYSGSDGSLYEDISTLTTALNIAEKIVVKIR
jgi:hypothetical protein